MLWWDGCDVVHCGFWLNRSQFHNHSRPYILTSIGNGTIRGLTLTLPTEWSLILVGFFALFLHLASGHLWRTLCFIIHQINASSRIQDDLYHQFQLLLRNAQGEGMFVGSLMKIGWAHMEFRFEVYRRSLFLIMLASSYGLGFYSLSGFSSRFVLESSGAVLALSRNCGWMEEADLFNLSDSKAFETGNALAVMAHNGYRRSASYSRSCYGRFGGNSTACRNFVQPSLPSNISRSVSCPFAQNICNGEGITLDSGFIRSDLHLGINTGPTDSISVRKILTCVPLAGEKYTDGWRPITDEEATYYNLPFEINQKGYMFGQVIRFPEGNYTVAINELLWKFGLHQYNIG